MTVQTAKRLLAVEEFYRMSQTGIFKPEERLELVDGEIITMTPIGQRHHASVMLLTMALAPRLEGRALVSVQGPLALGPDQLRYPDLALLRRQADAYRTVGPTATDAFLVIEVADTSIDYDRVVKVPLYARARIPEVWLVDLTTNHLEVYRRPGEGAYRGIRRLPRDQSIAPEVFPDVMVPLADILG